MMVLMIHNGPAGIARVIHIEKTLVIFHGNAKYPRNGQRCISLWEE